MINQFYKLILKLCYSIGLCLVLNTNAYALDEEKVSLNFVNADIESVIKAIGQISGRNFLIDPRVKGTINISSATPIAPNMAYHVLLSALRTQGFTAIDGDGVTTILPEADAKLRNSAIINSKSKVSGDQIVTQVFVIKYESAGLLVPVLKPLISPNNVINAYPNNNMLIITDYAENLKKVAKLIAAIDKPSTAENEVVKIKYANAVELSQILTKLADPQSADVTRKMIVIPDARSNSIILRSDNAGQISRAKNLIAQLDTAATSGNSIHVVYLRNADAKKLAGILQSLTLNTNGVSNVQSSSKSAANNQPAPAITNATGVVITPVNPTTTASPSLAESPFESSVSATTSMIQADTSTNSLIIAAPDNVFNTLRGVIDKLDVRRAQLYIEALVAEVSTDKAAEFGIQWQDLSNLDSTTGNSIRAFSGTKFNANGASITSVAQNVGTASNGLNIGILKGQINIPGIGTIANLGLLAHALESNVNANILSKPNLLTLDNEEAKIVIGQNVPFITGQYAQTGAGGGINPFQTVERKDVGLTLKVRPQISESDTIKLQIFQEVSSVLDTANAAGITTNKRSIETSVLIQDGNIIVLGGLIEDRISENINKVPLLGDIPVLGNLFKTQGRSHKKTNLMVFLRPYVMRDDDSASAITNDRYDYIRNEQEAVTPKSHWILPDVPTVQMPDINEKLYTKPVKPQTSTIESP